MGNTAGLDLEYILFGVEDYINVVMYYGMYAPFQDMYSFILYILPESSLDCIYYYTIYYFFG